MGNQVPKPGKEKRPGGGGGHSHAPTSSKSTTGADFQKSLRNYQQAQSEYQYLSKITHFDENTLRLLHARFTVIDQAMQEDGYISLQEFARILAVPEQSLLLQRFFKFMDKSDMGTLNFRNFAHTMSMLSLKASKEEKMKLSFFLYDINEDGVIDRGECKQMVIAALEQIEMRLTDDQIDQIVQNTFEVTDTNKDNKIDFDEYCEYCKKNPRILQSFQVDISKLIQYEHESRRSNHRYSNSMELRRYLHHGPNHSPNADNKFFGMKKIKVRVKNKVERVKSIHDADEILMNGGPEESWSDDDRSNRKSMSMSRSMKKSSSKHKAMNLLNPALGHHNNNNSGGSEDSVSVDPKQFFRKALSADITTMTSIVTNNDNNNNNNNNNSMNNNNNNNNNDRYPVEMTLSSTANFLAQDRGYHSYNNSNNLNGNSNNQNGNNDLLFQTHPTGDDSDSSSSSEEKSTNNKNNDGNSNNRKSQASASNNSNTLSDIKSENSKHSYHSGNNNNDNSSNGDNDKNRRSTSSSTNSKRSKSPFKTIKEKTAKRRDKSKSRSKSPTNRRNKNDSDSTRQKSANTSLTLNMSPNITRSQSKT